jgi:hypothetical protein
VAVADGLHEFDVYFQDLPIEPVASTNALAVKRTISPVGRR